VPVGWNEMDSDIKAGVAVYVKQLRRALDARGLQTTQIVAADGHSFGDITGPMSDDVELAAIVDVLGAHYPGTKGPGAAGLGKKAWSSEDYSQDAGGVGPACWARVINRNFVQGNLTATIAWNLVDSYYDGLPFGRNSLMTAHWPWSGHYSVDNPIWASAHTTQFTESGWLYSPVGQGSGWLPSGGSYVTLVPPLARQASFSTVNGQPAVTMVRTIPCSPFPLTCTLSRVRKCFFATSLCTCPCTCSCSYTSRVCNHIPSPAYASICAHIRIYTEACRLSPHL